MKMLLCLLLVINVISCTKEAKKTVAEVLSAKASDAVAVIGSCEFKNEIYDDFYPVIAKILKAEEEKALAASKELIEASSVVSDVCSMVVQSALPLVISGVIPSKYGCKLTNLSELYPKIAEYTCSKL